MKNNINDILIIENEKLHLQGRMLKLKNSNTLAIISKNQQKLITCLMQNINEKNEIINFIWGSEDGKSKESNYNQLVYQTRSLLVRHGFPDDFIITIHRYGLCLNKNFLKSKNSQYDSTIGICNDSMAGHSGLMDIAKPPFCKDRWPNKFYGE